MTAEMFMSSLLFVSVSVRCIVTSHNKSIIDEVTQVQTDLAAPSKLEAGKTQSRIPTTTTARHIEWNAVFGSKHRSGERGERLGYGALRGQFHEFWLARKGRLTSTTVVERKLSGTLPKLNRTYTKETKDVYQQ